MAELPRQSYVVDLLGGVVGSVIVVAENGNQAVGMAATAAADQAGVPLSSIELDGVYALEPGPGVVMLRIDVTQDGIRARHG